MSEDPTKGPIGPGDEFEDALKHLPNDLGEEIFKVPIEYDKEDDSEGELPEGFYALEAIPRFTNDDLDDGEMNQVEMEAMLRLFPEDQLAGGLIAAPGETVKELALEKLVKLARGIIQMEAMRQYMENLGADCDDDLVYAMLSAVGEMHRLRTLIPKIGYGMVEAEGGYEPDDGKEDAA